MYIFTSVYCECHQSKSTFFGNQRNKKLLFNCRDDKFHIRFIAISVTSIILTKPAIEL